MKRKSELSRITGITIAGKSFYFNVNRAKTGVAYLTVVGKKNQDEEKMTLFDSQIPSFIHKMMEAYAEICRENGVPLWGAVPASKVAAGIEASEEEELPSMKCPECGTGVYDPNAEYITGFLNIYRFGDGNDKVAVKCKQCGWHPDSASVSEANGAVFYRSSADGMHWSKYITW
jgi:hypothetical protein